MDIIGEALERQDENARMIRLNSALEGHRGPDQQRIAQEGLEWLDLLLRKNEDYGSSVWSHPALRPSMPVADAILVRMSDKVARIGSLTSKGDTPEVEESLEDTIRDLGAYCLLYLARP